MSIYVEIRICGTLDELWRLTQVPDLHVRWDLRFTDIQYLPRPDDTEPQRFLYTTRIGFGVAIQGQGETVGQRDGGNGERTSALKFWSEDPKSLIHEGAGYWRYVPTSDGVRFFTSYDYRVRYGAIGRIVDALLFRPLIGWATAWSFDRLRLWIEKGIDPQSSLQRSLIQLMARMSVAFVWLYQGVFPKLIYRHADELAMLQGAGIPETMLARVVQLVGWSEVLLGLAMLFWFHQLWPLILTILLMVGATAAVIINSPQFLVAAFNPVSLNALMISLALVGLLTSRDLPSARRCLRKEPKAGT